MTLLVAFCAAVAAAIVVMTVVQTAAAYPTLPEQVVLGFDFDGSARNTGARPMIWMLAVVQIVCAGVFVFAGNAIARHLPGTHGTLAGLALSAVPITAILWRVQMLLIDASRADGKRQPMLGFWMFFGTAIAALVAAEDDAQLIFSFSSLTFWAS